MNIIPPIFRRQPAPPPVDPALLDKVLELAVENALLKTKPRRAIRKDAGAYKDAKKATTTRLENCVGKQSLADHVDTINAGRARAA